MSAESPIAEAQIKNISFLFQNTEAASHAIESPIPFSMIEEGAEVVLFKASADGKKMELNVSPLAGIETAAPELSAEEQPFLITENSVGINPEVGTIDRMWFDEATKNLEATRMAGAAYMLQQEKEKEAKITDLSDEDKSLIQRLALQYRLPVEQVAAVARGQLHNVQLGWGPGRVNIVAVEKILKKIATNGQQLALAA